jgi:hypothetical protein
MMMNYHHGLASQPFVDVEAITLMFGDACSEYGIIVGSGR